jgi:hypothetical protein
VGSAGVSRNVTVFFVRAMFLLRGCCL